MRLLATLLSWLLTASAVFVGVYLALTAYGKKS